MFSDDLVEKTRVGLLLCDLDPIVIEIEDQIISVGRYDYDLLPLMWTQFAAECSMVNFFVLGDQCVR